MAAKVKIGLLGASGRMGRKLQELLKSQFKDETEISAMVSDGGNYVSLLDVDAIIDFSLPKGSISLAKAALEYSKEPPAFIIGTTGWSSDDLDVLSELSKKTAVFRASNFSTGIAALNHILEKETRFLTNLGFTPKMIEKHHVHKKDSPSGTALTLAEAVWSQKADYEIEAIREGEWIGDHRVYFESDNDYVVVGHHAKDRKIFAQGAIEVAIWAAKKKLSPGSYGMKEYMKDRGES